MSIEGLSELLYDQSGLLGVSGISGDMLALLEADDPTAAEAIDLFVYRGLPRRSRDWSPGSCNKRTGHLGVHCRGRGELAFDPRKNLRSL